MGCDWIQFDKDLEKKPEFVALRAATGEDEAAVGWRLKRFWSWVDDHVPTSGRLDRVMTLEALAVMFGGGEPFWAALIQVGWLARDDKGLSIPDWKKRFGKSAKARQLNNERSKRYRDKKKRGDARGEGAADNGRARDAARGERVATAPRDAIRKEETRQEETRRDQKTSGDSSNSFRASTSSGASGAGPLPQTRDAQKAIEGKDVDWPAAREECRRLVGRLGGEPAIEPDDRELVAKLAALLQLGAVSEHELYDSCQAVERAYKRPDPPRTSRFAYWHGTVRSMLENRGVTFNALLATISVPEDLRQPPRQAARPREAGAV